MIFDRDDLDIDNERARAMLRTFRVVVVFALLTLAAGPGCGKRLDQRIVSARKFARTNWAFPGPGARAPAYERAGKLVLAVLERTDNESLKSPIIASANTAPVAGAVGVLVFWVEDQPTPDAVVLRTIGSGTSIKIPIPDFVISSLKEDAKSTVVFGARVRVPAEWDRRLHAGGRVEAALVRDGQVVTSYCDVFDYRPIWEASTRKSPATADTRAAENGSAAPARKD